MAASASMPPTPQATMPRPLIMVVCESVPTRVSGNAQPSCSMTPLARYSRFTWWTMPMPGGTILRPSNACIPHLRNS